MSPSRENSITRRAFVGAGAALCAGGSSGARGQTIDKPARMVVGFPPGGSTDVLSRLIINQMKNWAPSLIMDNHSGAGGRLGVANVKSSPPDGSAMLLTPASIQVIYPHVYKKLGYDPMADFQAVTTVSSTAFALAVGPGVPAEVKTQKEFSAWCKANPGRAFYGSSCSGSMPHFAGYMIGRALGIDFTHVPFRGAAPAVQDLIAGQIATNIAVILNVLPMIQAGQVRALATTGAERSASLPDVPTFTELGYPDVTAEEWFGVFMPAATPPALVWKANEAIRAALQTRETREAMEKMALEIVSQSPADFAKIVEADIEKWRGIVAATGFTMDE